MSDKTSKTETAEKPLVRKLQSANALKTVMGEYFNDIFEAARTR